MSLPTVQYPLILNVLHAIADGKTELQACRDVGISVAAFRHRLKEDGDLAELYAEATKQGNDALADMLINIDQVHSAPAMAGVISKNIQWLLERRNPDKYGARVTVMNENRATQELIKALDKAIDRIPTANVPKIIDAEFTVMEPRKRAAPPALPRQVGPSTEDLKALGLLD